MSAPIGRVLSLHRYPVKSFAGESVDALRIERRGAGGDRAHALIWAGRDRRLTARQAPRMLAWQARYDVAGEQLDPGEPPLPLLTSPTGAAYEWRDPELPGVLERDLGRPVELRRDLAGQQDLPESLLVTVAASLDAVTHALDLTRGDVRRFRPNVHIELDAEAFAEERWAGLRLRVGETALELLHPCERCAIPTRDPDTQAKDSRVLTWLLRERRKLFGINARAPARGTIRAGDAVDLLPR